MNVTLFSLITQLLKTTYKEAKTSMLWANNQTPMMHQEHVYWLRGPVIPRLLQTVYILVPGVSYDTVFLMTSSETDWE